MYNIPLEGMIALENIWLDEKAMNKVLPSLICSHTIVTYWSRSGLDCSWWSPNAWPISCIAIPAVKQPNPRDILCFPPILPTYDQHLLISIRGIWKIWWLQHACETKENYCGAALANSPRNPRTQHCHGWHVLCLLMSPSLAISKT